jgi:integrase
VLDQWREVSTDSEFIFHQVNDREEGHKNWVNRSFRPAVKAAGVPAKLRPYDLRHACASLLNAEHVSTVQAAAWMGHGHELYTNTYCHEISSMRNKGRVDVDAEILAARELIASGTADLMFADCSQMAETVPDTIPAEWSESPVVIGDW